MKAQSQTQPMSNNLDSPGASWTASGLGRDPGRSSRARCRAAKRLPGLDLYLIWLGQELLLAACYS